MSTIARPSDRHILVVRLGAMGDIIHTLPAVKRLSQSGARITWAVESKWMPLLDGNPSVDALVPVQRGSARAFVETWRAIGRIGCDCAVDFQGLWKSAIVTVASRASTVYGFDQVREPAAAVVYTHRVHATSEHVVDRNLELADAVALRLGRSATCSTGVPVGIANSESPAGAQENSPWRKPWVGTSERPAPVGAEETWPANPPIFWLPPGAPEGVLPDGDFVLASPLAGWGSKQWPMEHYRTLAAMLRNELNLTLVLNGPPGSPFQDCGVAVPHYSGLPGLIHATRHARAVIGVDSGPLHLAAALDKPGVAIFGPTDPARNGPYGDSLRVLRSAGVETTYKRKAAIDASMQEISPALVLETLRPMLPAETPRGRKQE